MKRYWLRGVLLGVSMALLLAGGVALAQGLWVEPDCFQCVPGVVPVDNGVGPEYPYSYMWESCGWEPFEELYVEEWWALNAPPASAGPETADGNGCIGSEGPWGWTCTGIPIRGVIRGNAVNDHVFPDDYWGPFEICVGLASEQDVSANQALCETIMFAEVCEEDFVPEPGTIALLGSGLVGLAGYATLRWRTRE